tara:strand:+ start:5689 stop:5880 length:192 start_codon:yes stop_codon:yes gene_type:complete
MGITVKEVTLGEEKSVQEVEQVLLDKHEERLNTEPINNEVALKADEPSELKRRRRSFIYWKKI